MNKFAFFFPAKIAFAESAVELSPIEFQGETFYLGPIGKKYFFSTEKHKMIFQHVEDDKRQIFFKCGEYFLTVHLIFIDNIQAFLESILERIKSTAPKWQEYLNNPDSYEAEMTENRLKIRTEREQRDKDEAERKAARAKAAREAYENTLNNFKNNLGVVIWDTFEEACKEYGVKIPIKTIGYGRKNVISVSQTGLTVRGKCHNSPVLWQAIRELAAKLA